MLPEPDPAEKKKTIHECGHLCHEVCHMNRWLLYYKEQAAYMTKKSEFLDSALLGFLEDDNQGTVNLDKNARSEALNALTEFAKPVIPNCAICRTPASSTGGILHEK